MSSERRLAQAQGKPRTDQRCPSSRLPFASGLGLINVVYESDVFMLKSRSCTLRLSNLRHCSRLSSVATLCCALRDVLAPKRRSSLVEDDVRFARREAVP